MVSPLLVLLLLVLPSVDAACGFTGSGTIIVPTFTEDPPPHNNPSLMQGITIWKVPDVQSSRTFDLVPAAGSSTLRTCPLANCVEFPDFNVAWYTNSDQWVGQDDDVGVDDGPVPSGAQYALVYMRYGPDPGNGDGPFPWSTAASFDLVLHC